MNPKGINGEDIPTGSMIVDPKKVWGRVVLIAFVVLLLALAGVSFWLYRSEKRNDRLTVANLTLIVRLYGALEVDALKLDSLNIRFSESGKALLEEGPRAYLESVEAR